jgi:salicylate hydroxylase
MTRTASSCHWRQLNFACAIHAIFLVWCCNGLSFLTPIKKEIAVVKPIRKVAVIGSGIAGLSLAHALVNNIEHVGSEIQVEIFDARPLLDTTAGAGVQLNGGLAILGKINPSVQEAVVKAGIPQTGIQSQCLPWFSTPKSTKDMDVLLQYDLLQTVLSAGGDASESLVMESASKIQKLCWIAIMRGAIQQSLLDNLPQDPSKVTLTFQKKLISITDGIDGNGVTCNFADGSEIGPFDIVIGCDGINSSVKSCIDRQQGSSSTSAVYSGIRIRYAVSDGLQSKQHPDDTNKVSKLTQYFGNGAYALHGIYGSGIDKPATKCSFVVYLDNDYVGPIRVNDNPETNGSKTGASSVGENSDWTQNKREQDDIARTKMLQQLQDAGIPANVEDPLAGTIAIADRFFELGVYFHNPLGIWCKKIGGKSRSFAVLCGDAAHAMPPFLGQGSNQAIQDAYCLAEQIFKYNDDVSKGEIKYPDELQQYLTDYQRIRFPATFGIFWKSCFLGYLETGGKNGFYSKFRDVLFTTLNRAGIAVRVLLSAATPKVK